MTKQICSAAAVKAPPPLSLTPFSLSPWRWWPFTDPPVHTPQSLCKNQQKRAWCVYSLLLYFCVKTLWLKQLQEKKKRVHLGLFIPEEKFHLPHVREEWQQVGIVAGTPENSHLSPQACEEFPSSQSEVTEQHGRSQTCSLLIRHRAFRCFMALNQPWINTVLSQNH